MPTTKILLMGPAYAGKTSMKTIIFADTKPNHTWRLTQTNRIDSLSIAYLDLEFSLWDCGGHGVFWDYYFSESGIADVFPNVGALIYVVDVQSVNFEKELSDFEMTMGCLRDSSPDAKVFVLVHKVDLVRNMDKRLEIFKEKVDRFESVASNFKIQFFQTSIWEESLYRAWSSIVHTLTPNADKLRDHLEIFLAISEADEAIIFEQATFLEIVCVVSEKAKCNLPDRFERISHNFKYFKMQCRQSGTEPNIISVSQKNSFTLISKFTTNTFIMVSVSDPEVSKATTMLNIAKVKEHFETLL